MVEQQSPNTQPEGFSSPEEEIAALERRLAERRAELLTEEQQEEAVEQESVSPEREREHLRDEIKRHVQETPHPTTPVRRGALPKIQEEPQAQQVSMLVELALDEGVVHAVKVAEELDDPYLLSRLHDELVDHFYTKLTAKEGRLKKL